jgi:GntR family transcriptional regulator, transcriptional repressor for pyruvate dehydrogenase complex
MTSSSPLMSESERLSLRVPKTAELVAGHLRRQIVRGELSEGDALPPESALMEQFGISRPTLREAFRILESEGLITVRRGARGGARVQVPSGDVAAQYAGLVLQYRSATLSDVFEARAIVEAPAARMVAARRDRATAVKRLEAAHLAEQEAGADQSSESATDFHRVLVELTGNQTMILLTDMLEYISTAVGQRLARQPGIEREVRRGQKSHQKLIELIRAGKAAEAETYWRQHLTEVGNYLIKERGGGGTVLDVLS